PPTNPLAPPCRHALTIILALYGHGRERSLIDWVVDQAPEVIGMGAREQIRIRHNNDPLPGTAAQEPGGQRHRCAQRLEVPWRQGDDEPAYFAGLHLCKLPGNGFQMPVVFESHTGPD